jgi:hypothetical protein
VVTAIERIERDKSNVGVPTPVPDVEVCATAVISVIAVNEPGVVTVTAVITPLVSSVTATEPIASLERVAVAL